MDEHAVLERGTTRALRGLVLGLFSLGAIGVGVELLLLEHFEKPWQRLPLLLLSIGLLTVCWQAVSGGRPSLVVFRWLMLTYVGSGLFGLWLHYQGNVEFELELAPSIGGLELFSKAVHGAFPALAPGAIIELGLLGLVYTYDHPALRRSATVKPVEGGGR